MESAVPVAAVAVGGAAGAAARFAVTLWLAHRLGGPLPWGTLAVNVLGSFVLGVVVGFAPSPSVRALLGTGFCGGFTTFSTFAVETLAAPPGPAALHVGANVAGACGAAALGLWVGRTLRSGGIEG